MLISKLVELIPNDLWQSEVFCPLLSFSIELVNVFFQFSFHLVRDCVLGILIYIVDMPLSVLKRRLHFLFVYHDDIYI